MITITGLSFSRLSYCLNRKYKKQVARPINIGVIKLNVIAMGMETPSIKDKIQQTGTISITNQNTFVGLSKKF